MEVRGRQPGQPASVRERLEEARVRNAHATRSLLQEAREARTETARSAAGDRLELSAEPSDAEIGPERMAELREAALRGILNSPERIERAAGRILGGE